MLQPTKENVTQGTYEEMVEIPRREVLLEFFDGRGKRACPVCGHPDGTHRYGDRPDRACLSSGVLERVDNMRPPYECPTVRIRLNRQFRQRGKANV